MPYGGASDLDFPPGSRPHLHASPDPCSAPRSPSLPVWGFSVLRPPAHLLGSDETHHVFFLGGGVLICWNRGLSSSRGRGEGFQFSEQPEVRVQEGEDKEGDGAP